jgi:hypothetical protein
LTLIYQVRVNGYNAPDKVLRESGDLNLPGALYIFAYTKRVIITPRRDVIVAPLASSARTIDAICASARFCRGDVVKGSKCLV